MELRHLRSFVAVAEEQNVTRAAARLHISQPPLSRQMRELEAELGVALFERSAKSLRLNEVGRVFLVEARAALDRVSQAVNAVRAAADGTHGEIHVAFAPSLTVEILPQALRRFHELRPGVQVRMYDRSTIEMVNGLREGAYHVALMIQTAPHFLDGLAFEELRRYAVCVAMHPAHTLSRARWVKRSQIAIERLIAYTRADYPEYHAWLTTLFGDADKMPRVSEEHDSSTSLIAAVEAGRGIALVQEGFQCLAGPRLVLRPLHPAPAPFVVGVAYRKEDRSEGTRSFVEAAKPTPATRRSTVGR